MALKVVCCYSHLTGPTGWQDPQHCVNQFVNALKGRSVQGFAHVALFPGCSRLRLDFLNSIVAVEWFGCMAAQILREEALESPPVLVPVPSSKCDVGVRVSRTCRLADAIAGRLPATVRDVLRFDEPMMSAHAEQGPRDAAFIYQHLRLVGNPDIRVERPYVLVDDVVASGGHLLASAAFLQGAGARVALAVCGASADRQPHPSPFSRVTRELVDDRFW